MNQLSHTDLRRLSAAELEKLVPVELTINGFPRFVIDTPENIITLSDLHPRVRIQLKALERKARLGMPKVQKVFALDVMVPVSKVGETNRADREVVSNNRADREVVSNNIADKEVVNV